MPDLQPGESHRTIARTALKWITFTALPVLAAIDLLAWLGLVPWVPPQLHGVLGITIIVLIVEWNARRRSKAAVLVYQLGHQAGRVDQQREWEVVHGGVRPLAKPLHQNLPHRADTRDDRAAVLPFARGSRLRDSAG